MLTDDAKGVLAFSKIALSFLVVSAFFDVKTAQKYLVSKSVR
jgi:hypothetical protein